MTCIILSVYDGKEKGPLEIHITWLRPANDSPLLKPK